MSDKRFETVKGVDNNVNKEAYFIQDTYEGCILGGSYWKEEWAKKDCNLLNNIHDEKNHLQNVIDLYEYQLKVQDRIINEYEEELGV